MDRETEMKRMGLSRWFEYKMRQMPVGKAVPSTPPVLLKRMLGMADGPGDDRRHRRMGRP